MKTTRSGADRWFQSSRSRPGGLEAQGPHDPPIEDDMALGELRSDAVGNSMHPAKVALPVSYSGRLLWCFDGLAWPRGRFTGPCDPAGIPMWSPSKGSMRLIHRGALSITRLVWFTALITQFTLIVPMLSCFAARGSSSRAAPGTHWLRCAETGSCPHPVLSSSGSPPDVVCPQLGPPSPRACTRW
jgi:hypothetical protein